MPFSKVKNWLTGYNPNASEEGGNPFRYNAYWGGVPQYGAFLNQAGEENYAQIAMN